MASRDRQRGAAAAVEYGIERAYDSYEELLVSPSIDAVYLPLPNDLHAPWIRAAADAGKHILCEKPLAMDEAEAEAVTTYCRERSVLLMEAFTYRFHPAWAEARRLLADGAIGKLLELEMWFAFRSSQESADYRMTMARGGGALLDVGCYAVNLSRWLLRDDPRTVLATASPEPSSMGAHRHSRPRTPSPTCGSSAGSMRPPASPVRPLGPPRADGRAVAPGARGLSTTGTTARLPRAGCGAGPNRDPARER